MKVNIHENPNLSFKSICPKAVRKEIPKIHIDKELNGNIFNGIFVKIHFKCKLVHIFP